MLNYLKHKLNMGKDKEVPAQDQFYTPLRIGLHSTVEVDLVDLLVAKSSLHENLVLPSSSMEVMGIGILDSMYHIYGQDDQGEEFLIQMYINKHHRTGEDTISEVNLYRQVSSSHPQNQTEWDDALLMMTLPSFTLDEVVYNRVWGGTSTSASLLPFSEKIILPRDVMKYDNEFMLHSRNVDTPTGKVEELCLVGTEVSDEEAAITIHLGVSLNVNNVKVL